MSMLRVVPALASVMMLTGCASMTRAILIPKYNIEVPAQDLQLRPRPAAQVSAATTPTGNIIEPGAAADSALDAGPVADVEPVAVALEDAPDRTDLRGAGDGSMKVERVVISAAKPVPRRVPNFSPEQVAAMVCVTQRFGFGNEAARRAHQATLDAVKARADLDARRITQKQADAIELKRQDAVRVAMNPIPLFNMIGSTGEKKSDLPAPRYRSVVIEDTDLFTFKENGAPVMAVSGRVRNTGPTEVDIPPITLRAIDDWDFALAGQSSLLPFQTLAPGEARDFEVRFLNPPEYTGEVYVHFAPPFLYRGSRDCDFFDPSRYDPSQPLETLPPLDDASKGPGLSIGSIRRYIADAGPRAGATTPDYTASELSLLTRYYRRESERAWRCRPGGNVSERSGGRPGGLNCASAEQRLGWRDMFEMAEALDETWSAMRALEEAKAAEAAGRGSPALLTAAQSAHARAIALVHAIGDAALARSGESLADIVIDLGGATLGYDGKTVYLDVAGRVRNTGQTAHAVQALMIAAVDRFGLPLTSAATPFERMLEPAGSIDFRERVPLNRPPPRQFDWQVVVGAMSAAD
jgi:hypothetical protein